MNKLLEGNRIYYVVGAMVLTSVIIFLSLAKKKSLQALNWSNDANFFTNSDGKNLSKLASNVGITLQRNKGLGGSYDKSKYQSYKTNSNVYWAIYDINNDKLIATSSNASTNVYGASVPKVCVSAAAFSKTNGKLPSDSDYEKVIKLLVQSDNNVWTAVQNIAGGDDGVNSWASYMGYKMKPARKGGNQSNAIDMCKFWADVCYNRFAGADNIFRITSSCQTSASRSKKLMPTNVLIGGKTGSWESYNHDTCWIQNGNRFYSISVLTTLGSAGSDAIAQMFRGLYEEYAN
jgi:hypothetical protein